MPRKTLAIRLTIAGLASALAVVSFFLDDAVAELAARPIRSGQMRATLASLSFFGESGPMVLLAAAAWLLAPAKRSNVVLAIIAAILAGVAVDRAKTLSARSRPIDTLPAAASESWQNDENGGRNSSFPSGHTATAFAFGRGLSLAFPTVTPVVFIAATGTAISRMHEQRHYFSDCVVAALFGWFATGWFNTLASRWIPRSKAHPRADNQRANKAA